MSQCTVSGCYLLRWNIIFVKKKKVVTFSSFTVYAAYYEDE